MLGLLGTYLKYQYLHIYPYIIKNHNFQNCVLKHGVSQTERLTGSASHSQHSFQLCFVLSLLLLTKIQKDSWKAPPCDYQMSVLHLGVSNSIEFPKLMGLSLTIIQYPPENFKCSTTKRKPINWEAFKHCVVTQGTQGPRLSCTAAAPPVQLSNADLCPGDSAIRRAKSTVTFGRSAHNYAPSHTTYKYTYNPTYRMYI